MEIVTAIKSTRYRLAKSIRSLEHSLAEEQQYLDALLAQKEARDILRRMLPLIESPAEILQHTVDGPEFSVLSRKIEASEQAVAQIRSSVDDARQGLRQVQQLAGLIDMEFVSPRTSQPEGIRCSGYAGSVASNSIYQ